MDRHLQDPQLTSPAKALPRIHKMLVLRWLADPEVEAEPARKRVRLGE